MSNFMVEQKGTAPVAAAPPASEVGYTTAVVPGWGFFGGTLPGAMEDIPQLTWPTSVTTFHQMRTDTQIDALQKSVSFPLRRLNWMIDPNGARDEIVEEYSQMWGLPIKGNNDDFIIRGRPTFNHDNHLRLALLAPTVYGHMPFEYVGEIKTIGTLLKWWMSNLAVRMPHTIGKWDVARNGDLVSVTQLDPRNFRPPPIPASQLLCYTWDLEGGNYAGRSMLRPLYKHWILKDRLLRIDAMKNERFGAGIPKGTAPIGGDPADYQRMASATRASETGGVGVAAGGDFSIEGVRGTLPDTIASIRYQDEAMARSFLAMFMQLGQTETGSRALGESFVDFFQDALWGFVKWYTAQTNEVFYRIADWNYGEDEQSPLLTGEEGEDRKLDATDLANLVRSGALIVDTELQGWIRKQFDMPDYTGGAPLPSKPGNPSQDANSEVLANEQGKSRQATRVIAGYTTKAGGGHVRVVHPKASSQTVNTTKVGHRQPTAVEVAAATDFDKLQKEWEKVTTTLVDDWSDIREEQIDSLIKDVEAAVKAGDTDALAKLAAPTLGDDLILAHMKDLAGTAITQGLAEASAQGVTLPKLKVSDIEDELATRAGAISQLMANGISQSASTQALLRFGVGSLTPKEVGDGVRGQLDSLSDSYLNDVLGGALTQAQNTARRRVMEQSTESRIYSSELMDENTCEACADVDGTEYESIEEASSDYPAGGYSECLGGARCRGTLVAVYGEGEPQ